MGFIKIHRNIREWGWYDDANTLAVWIHLLVDANFEERTWHGKTVGIGSTITSVARLSEQTGLSIKQVRTCIGRLVEDGKIVTKGANKWTEITICDYESYMLNGESEGRTKGEQKANKRQTNGEQKATLKEEYNTSDTKVSSSSIQETLFKEEKEEDTIVSTKKEQIDFDSIKKMWNDSMTRTKKIPRVASLSQARKEKINLRVSEMGGWESAKEIIRQCFEKIDDSDFCNGENENVWVATFDWFFMNDKNWLKVLEGNYDNRKRKTSLDIMKENIAKADAYYEQRYRYAGTTAYGVPPGGGQDGPDEQ